jgi:winged helix-turn-helix protein DUF2582
MDQEIGTVAGQIWTFLNEKRTAPLAQIKKAVKAKAPVFDWAIGWLAREGKIEIALVKRAYHIRLLE